MNPIYNKQEVRLRAGIRIPVFVVLFFLLISIGASLFSFHGFEFIISGILGFGFFWVSFRFTDNRSDISLAGVELNAEWFKEWGIGVAAGFVAVGFIFITQWLSGDITLNGFVWNRPGSHIWLIPLAGYFFQMLSVGFYEELMARSYLIPNLKEGFTFWKITPQNATVLAIVISSGIFSFLHLANPNPSALAMINITLAGVMLALPYVLTGRLSISVGLHFSWNFFLGGIFGFRVSGIEPVHPLISIRQEGNPIWTGGNFGPEGGIIGTIAILLIVFFILRYIRYTSGKLEFIKPFQKSYLQNQQSLTNSDELA